MSRAGQDPLEDAIAWRLARPTPRPGLLSGSDPRACSGGGRDGLVCFSFLSISIDGEGPFLDCLDPILKCTCRRSVNDSLDMFGTK